MSEEMPELPIAENPNSALGVALGAAHFWKRKHDRASKHRMRILGIGVILGMLIAEFGPELTAWASSAF